MKELLVESLNHANIVYTCLLVFVMGYWLIVLLGFIDLSSLDIEVDVDADMDMDTEVDTGVEQSSSGQVSWFNNVLIFFNLQHVPLMVFLTFLILPMWMLALFVHHSFHISSFLFALIPVAPIFIIGLFTAKLATIPVAKLFEKLDEDREMTDPVGKLAELRLPIKANKIGQAEIKDVNGNVVSINVISVNGQPIAKGQQVLVIKRDKEQKVYLVESYN